MFGTLGTLGTLWMAGCGAALTTGGTSAGATKRASAAMGSSSHRLAADAIEVPAAPTQALQTRTLVSSGLLNPRGMHLLEGGDLLVAEAGTGDPEQPLTGALSRFSDRDANGAFSGAGERTYLLQEQPSKNILSVVRRDEVFGMAGMDAGDAEVLVSLAFFGGPSTLYSVRGDVVQPWGATHLNINDLTFNRAQNAWYGVSSTSNEVVKLLPGHGTERVLSIPPLDNGQDSVPGYLVSDPTTGNLLVSLFTGSPEGEEGGEGVELVPRAGGIIEVDPATGRFVWLVTGLTVPTDLVVSADGSIYVLEFCDAFMDPVATREAMWQSAGHGGFRRFSGRLLRIQRNDKRVTVLARHLDAPSNLELAGDQLYIAEGMGTPGRDIPGPQGPIKLQGFIERLTLPAVR